MRLLTEWVDGGVNVAAEERATVCDLRIFVNRENACAHWDPVSGAADDCVTIPAVHLAEGLARDWWTLFGARDRKHPILKYRSGFVLPDLSLRCDGSTFEISGERCAFANPNLRFRSAGSEVLPRAEAESVLAGFITSVIERLASEGVTDSEVGRAWSLVSASLGDPEERAFCEAAGALGADPYDIPDALAESIERAQRPAPDPGAAGTMNAR